MFGTQSRLHLVFRVVTVFVFCRVGGVSLCAADWPTWRHDATRSARSEQALPAKLALHWERRFPVFEPAFPFTARLQFDASYEPVVAGNRLFLGSPADGSVRAFDVASGEELWCFYSNAPVRLAPAVWRDRIVFGSDDGRFYCLDVATGALRWKFRAFPEDRPDLHLLGNNRLISMWPVRGGAVVDDDAGVVYFASGMWPTVGVFVYALRIADGKLVWRNDRLNYLAKARIDHNARFDAGISPVGYLSMKGDRLVLATGRSQPMGLKKANGELIYYVQGYRNGDCRVALGGDYAFVGRDGVVSLVDFREVGSKWLSAGKNAPDAFDLKRMDLYEGPYHRYKFFPGCDAFSVFDGLAVYGFQRGVLYGYDLAGAALSEYDAQQANYPLKPLRWDVPLLFRTPTRHNAAPSRLFIKAGNRLYGHAGNTLLVLQLTEDKRNARVDWTHELPARPTSMVAAADRLFVVLKDGRLLCFGDATAAPKQSPIRQPTSRPLPESGAAVARLKGLLERMPKRKGFAVVLGAADGSLCAAFLQDSLRRVLGVAGDPARADALRDVFGSNALYGKRIEVWKGTALEFPLPAYLADALLIDGTRLPPPGIDALRRLWRSVHPFGGMLAFIGSEAPCAEFADVAKSARLSQARVERLPGAVLVLRPGPLPGAADWTHESGDAARTYFSRDTLVKTPLAPLWFGEGPDYGFFKVHDYGGGVKPQVCDGRVYALQQFSGTLVAYDAYTGLVQWRKQVLRRTPTWPWLRDGSYEWSWVASGGKVIRYASMSDGVYVVDKHHCRVLDPATGRELRSIDLRTADKKTPDLIGRGVFVGDDSVVIPASSAAADAEGKPVWEAGVLVCADRAAGTVRWVRRAENRFNVKAVALGRDRVFCVDSISPVQTDLAQRRGRPPSKVASGILALDARTGAVLWTRRVESPYRVYGIGAWLSLRGRDDWLAYSARHDILLAGRENRTVAFNGTSGKELWRSADVGTQPVMVDRDVFMDQSARVFDLRTGKMTRAVPLFRRGGCNYGVAGPNLAFIRDKTVCYVELDTGNRNYLRNMRSGCSASLVPAGGLLNAPNFSQGCMCNYPLQTCSAWSQAEDPGIAAWAGTEPLALKPPMKGPDIPRITPEQAVRMHEFKRRFVITSEREARKHLLGHWTFDDIVPDRPRRVPDVSGHDFPAILSADASLKPGVLGRALACAAAEESCAFIPWKAHLVIRDAVTLAAWIKLDPFQTKGATGIFERPQYFRLMVVDTKAPYSIVFNVQTDEHRWAGAGSPRIVKAGVWTHVAGTFDGETGELVIYLDGKKVRAGHTPPGSRIPPLKSRLAIGVRDGTAYLGGLVDEVRIYDRVLAPDLIRNLSRLPPEP
ncbi:MAG: PQQ-binding-like beta-propeller repeat protein [Kiritimatiellaeota bacterium]|nr:PQQ-binding-like beta-propeller repeat protein [Kiritimatiellota bacterium]